MKLHWKILLWMVAGALVGAGFQQVLTAPAWLGAVLTDAPEGGVRVESVTKDLLPKGRTPGEKLMSGDRLTQLVLFKGIEGREQVIAIESVEQLESRLDEIDVGIVASLTVAEGGARTVALAMQPAALSESPWLSRDRWLTPFRFIADIFMRLLKMLIVPLVITSIITGVAGLGGGKDFGRMGSKTLGYYMLTSLLAAGLGLTLVTIMSPGTGAELGLAPSGAFTESRESLWEIFRRMVPENIFTAFSDNSKMLQIIFFSILFGFFITRVSEEHRKAVLGFFDGAFHVVMALAGFVMHLVPYGVFALVVKVVGETGFGVFKPLLYYMLTVFIALLLHAGVTLPLLLRFVGKISPIRWFKAMTPALMTAFSTSSSSMTLPVTLETIEERGEVSNRTTSFVAPLGATVNMDGTALYECIGVIFLAQYYSGDAALAIGDMVIVVIAALLASIGAAGIPSAGLVMMLTILSALDLPLEGAALLLAVDRPLDMCRTVVNVWSDTCGSAIIASSEGEELVASIRKG